MSQYGKFFSVKIPLIQFTQSTIYVFASAYLILSDIIVGYLDYFTKSLFTWGSKINLIYNLSGSYYVEKVMGTKKKSRDTEFRQTLTENQALPLDLLFKQSL